MFDVQVVEIAEAIFVLPLPHVNALQYRTEKEKERGRAGSNGGAENEAKRVQTSKANACAEAHMLKAQGGER